jgi:2-polyprenyl-3-methyl-5-hydroxy-6-metoxy-1,4-benzoquinol methylase
MSYADRTLNSRNPLVRIAHRSRLKKAITTVASMEFTSLLDYGCGDGAFLNALLKYVALPVKLVGYEPFMDPIEANTVKIFAVMEDVLQFKDATTQTGFDLVTCFEVLEHFSPERQVEAISAMQGLLKPGGMLIISVPIESGVPGLVKNVVRRFTQQRGNLYTIQNILRSLLRRPMPEYRLGQAYQSHMGFYYEDLELILRSKFTLARREMTPLNALGKNFNSQIFYLLQNT